MAQIKKLAEGNLSDLTDKFHRLWGKAHDLPGYDKAEWQAICNGIEALESELQKGSNGAEKIKREMTVKELRDELEKLEDDRTIKIFVGAQSFPIEEVLVVSNRHEVLLEANTQRPATIL